MTEYPRTFPRSEQNNLWKTTALAPDQRLRRGRSTTQQCWRDHRQAMALQEHTKRRSRTRSSAKVTRGGRWRLGKEEANVRGSHARAETNMTGNKYQDIRSSLRRIKRAVPTAGRKEQCQEQADKSCANSRQKRAVPRAGRQESERADLQLVKRRAVDTKEVKVRNMSRETETFESIETQKKRDNLYTTDSWQETRIRTHWRCCTRTARPSCTTLCTTNSGRFCSRRGWPRKWPRRSSPRTSGKAPSTTNTCLAMPF